MTDKTKPCPFCSGTDIQFEADGDGNGWHTCPSCGAQGPLENKRQSDEDPHWDRRPAHDDLVKALRAVEAPLAELERGAMPKLSPVQLLGTIRAALAKAVAP